MPRHWKFENHTSVGVETAKCAVRLKEHGHKQKNRVVYGIRDTRATAHAILVLIASGDQRRLRRASAYTQFRPSRPCSLTQNVVEASDII